MLRVAALLLLRIVVCAALAAKVQAGSGNDDMGGRGDGDCVAPGGGLWGSGRVLHLRSEAELVGRGGGAREPFQVLALLLERPGEVVTREELRQKLWPADTFVDFDVGLNTAIKRLRDALSDTAESPRYVETLPRRGYRFIAQVDGWAAATAPSSPAKIPTARRQRGAVAWLGGA